MAAVSYLRPVEPDCSITTIVLPGILERPDEQFAPILSALPGAVLAVEPNPRRFDVDAVVYATVQQIEIARQVGHRVNLLGASIGGMLLAFVVDAYRKKHRDENDLSWLHVVLIDAPSGAETMSELPSWARQLVGSRLFALTMSGSFGDWVVARMVKSPRPEEIEATSRKERADIIEQARQNLSGHSGSLWQQQLAWMVGVGISSGTFALEDAALALAGVRTTYLACVHPGNVTVDQPTASQLWQIMVPGMTVDRVAAVHCGFLQQRQLFVEALDHILNY